MMDWAETDFTPKQVRRMTNESRAGTRLRRLPFIGITECRS